MTRKQILHSGLILVAVATFAMAFKGIFARLVYQEGVVVNALLVWRFILAVPLFWFGGVLMMRGRDKPPLTAKEWYLCGITGFLFFISAWCDFHAIEALGASISRMVLYLFPAILILIEALELRQMPTTRQLLIFAGAWAGIGMIVLPDWHGGELGAVGLAYGLGAALSYAIFWRMSQPIMNAIGSVRFNQVTNSFTLVALAIFLLPTLELSQLALTPAAFGWMTLLVIFSTVVPFFILFEGIKRSNSVEAGVVAMFGPVVTVVVALAVFPDEALTPLLWAGIVVVLVSVGVLKLVKPRPAVLSPAAAEPVRT
ncbi:DMT family transporter [Allohahella marinimesophila]|uniref:DMT family transporter n=1 Tax=Allohahella marinimesophila TaxID=1054972 RepID=A0ABP7PR71_9GAMM